jgi:hypothetical protein
MKSTAPGMVIGQALSSFDGSAPYYPYVIVKVNPFFYDPTNVTYQLVDGMRLQQASETQALFAQTNGAAYLINQQGSGDLLQLQAGGVDKLLVKNNGSILVNTTSTQPTENLITVKSADSDVFTLNTRGDVAVAGSIIITDTSYAGSIATNANGLAEVQFTHHLGTGKPSVQLTPEGEGNMVLVQISHWMKDENQNYTGVVIKTANLDGTPASAIVHYLVIGKPAGYATAGQTIIVYNEPPPTGEVAGTTTTTTTETITTETATEPAPSATPADTAVTSEPTPEPASETIITTSETIVEPVAGEGSGELGG